MPSHFVWNKMYMYIITRWSVTYKNEVTWLLSWPLTLRLNNLYLTTFISCIFKYLKRLLNGKIVMKNALEFMLECSGLWQVFVGCFTVSVKTSLFFMDGSVYTHLFNFLCCAFCFVFLCLVFPMLPLPLDCNPQI